ncbi:unnamed protein product [Amoebophrya sp. A120]|nr:unnamed protein product [Amoebophrya sp. A120]|eukprot:GSA120T00010252001.1
MNGTSLCPCVGGRFTQVLTTTEAGTNSGLFEGGSYLLGTFLLAPTALGVFKYPQAYGAKCGTAWDAELPPYCRTSSTTSGTGLPGTSDHTTSSVAASCAQPWCYVDADACRGVSRYPSEYFKGRVYSYDTCLAAAASPEINDGSFTSAAVVKTDSIFTADGSLQFGMAFHQTVVSTGLQGRTLRFAFPAESKPWHWRDSTGRWTGLMADYLRAISIEGGFSLREVTHAGTTQVFAPNRATASTTGAGTSTSRSSLTAFSRETFKSAWDACIHDVQMGVIDVCPTAAWLVDNRRAMTAFTQPLLNGDQRLLVRRYKRRSFWSDPTQWFGVFSPFSPTLWLATFFICVGGGLLLVLVEGPACVSEEHSEPDLQHHQNCADKNDVCTPTLPQEEQKCSIIWAEEESKSERRDHHCDVRGNGSDAGTASQDKSSGSVANQTPGAGGPSSDAYKQLPHDDPEKTVLGRLCFGYERCSAERRKTAFFALCTSVYLSLYGLLVLDLDVPHKCTTFKGRTVKYLLACIIFVTITSYTANLASNLMLEHTRHCGVTDITKCYARGRFAPGSVLADSVEDNTAAGRSDPAIYDGEDACRRVCVATHVAKAVHAVHPALSLLVFPGSKQTMQGMVLRRCDGVLLPEHDVRAREDFQKFLVDHDLIVVGPPVLPMGVATPVSRDIALSYSYLSARLYDQGDFFYLHERYRDKTVPDLDAWSEGTDTTAAATAGGGDNGMQMQVRHMVGLYIIAFLTLVVSFTGDLLVPLLYKRTLAPAARKTSQLLVKVCSPQKELSQQGSATVGGGAFLEDITVEESEVEDGNTMKQISAREANQRRRSSTKLLKFLF